MTFKCFFEALGEDLRHQHARTKHSFCIGICSVLSTLSFWASYVFFKFSCVVPLNFLLFLWVFLLMRFFIDFEVIFHWFWTHFGEVWPHFASPRPLHKRLGSILATFERNFCACVCAAAFQHNFLPYLVPQPPLRMEVCGRGGAPLALRENIHLATKVRNPCGSGADSAKLLLCMPLRDESLKWLIPSFFAETLKR